MRPLKFHPILKQTLWGGERIIPYKELASELSRVGESWELSGMPGSESVVAEGPWTGSTLPELIGRFGAELLGKANYARFGQEFPLLVKFIDAREDLSIQVHPDDELARKRHGKSGKCEMWYVLEAEPGASLLTGFSRPIAPAEYERRVADNTLTDVLNRQAIASGDVFICRQDGCTASERGPSSSRSSKVRTSPTGSTISTGGMQRAIPGSCIPNWHAKRSISNLPKTAA